MMSEWNATKQTYKRKAQVMDAEATKTDRTGRFKRTVWSKHHPMLVELLVNRSVAGPSTLRRQHEVEQRPMARLQNPEYLVMFVWYILRIVADGEARVACCGGGSSSDEDDTTNTSKAYER